MARIGPPISRETYENAMRDYIGGMKINDIARKWGISKGYLYNKMAKQGARLRRMDSKNVANYRDGQINKSGRKLIPYAGKE
jgi:uncharacterized protein YjcR